MSNEKEEKMSPKDIHEMIHKRVAEEGNPPAPDGFKFAAAEYFFCSSVRSYCLDVCRTASSCLVDVRRRSSNLARSVRPRSTSKSTFGAGKPSTDKRRKTWTLNAPKPYLSRRSETNFTWTARA